MVCFNLLKDGFIQSYKDYYSLFINKNTKIDAKILTNEQLNLIQETLVKIEEKTQRNQYSEVLNSYLLLADKNFKTCPKISKYIYEKIMKISIKYLSEVTDKKMHEEIEDCHIKGKLGFIKCLDF